jgi:hypothetical protein
MDKKLWVQLKEESRKALHSFLQEAESQKQQMMLRDCLSAKR